MKGYNEDGCTVASALDVRFLKYTDAVKRILEDESMTAYLAKDSEVSITVLGKTVEKQEEMLANVSSCTASLHENVQCSHGDKEEVSKAHESGVSFGKYKAFLELQQLRPEIKIEDVENLSMHEIHEMMQAQQHEERQHAEEKRHAEENHAEEDYVEENREEETDKEGKPEEKETEPHHNHEEEKEGKKSHHKQK